MHTSFTKQPNNSLYIQMTKPFFATIVSFLCVAQTLSGQFLTDKRTGCKIVDEKYWESDSVTWSDQCKNNLAEGQGILIWYQNKKVVATYNGKMSKGYPNGKGKYVIDGYGTMEGNFTNGWLNGHGKVVFVNNSKIEGNFLNGSFLNLDNPYLQRLQRITSGIRDSSNLYDNGDNDDELFYYALPPKYPAKAVLVLLPSTFESVENVISCNRELMQKCYDSRILTVVLSANYNNTLESDPAAMRFFNLSFMEISEKFKVSKDKFILSGLSLGGNNALQYTEMSRNPKYSTSIQPIAVIGIDPPVDQVDLYHHAKEAIELYRADSSLITESIQLALNEDHFLIDYFHTLYGGSPEEVPEKYIEGSNFSRTQADGGNAKYLIDIPVRLYADPDILWNLKYKNRDYYHINAANLSAMTNFLMMKGNKRVEFIPAIGKGYRVDGTRHPHSWSIVEPDDCIRWILEIVK
jgi:hypothetical protein